MTAWSGLPQAEVKGEQCSRQISNSYLSVEWNIDAVVTCCFPLGGICYCFPHSLPQDKIWAIFLYLLIFCTLLFTHWSNGLEFTFGVYVFRVLFLVTFILLSSLWGFINRLLVSSLRTLDWVSLPSISHNSFSCLTLLCTLCPYSLTLFMHQTRLVFFWAVSLCIIKYFFISE